MARDLRELGLSLMQHHIRGALALEPGSDIVARLARFARATIDGALIAERADGTKLADTLAPLPVALISIYRASVTASE